MKIRSTKLGCLSVTFAMLILSAGSLSAQTYVDAVMADSPVAYYRLNETSTLNPAVDSAGGNTGNYTFNFGSLGSDAPNETNGFPGLAGNVAPHFSGQDVIQATSAALDGPETDAFSIELWFNPKGSEAPYGELAAKGPNPSAQTWYLLHWGDNPWGITPGLVRFGVNGQGPGPQAYDSNTLILPSEDQWYHIVATYDTKTENSNIFINGALDASATVTPPGPTSAGEPLLIGGLAQEGNLANFINGGIDEVAYYGTALSASQVQAHYNAAVPEPSSVLLLVVGACWILLRRK